MYTYIHHVFMYLLSFHQVTRVFMSMFLMIKLKFKLLYFQLKQFDIFKFSSVYIVNKLYRIS